MPLSTFLNGGAPSQLRGLAWLALSDRGSVLVGTATSDSGGGATQAWVAAGTFDCRVDPINAFGNSRITGGVIDERSTHIVTAPPGTSVSTSNRFAITGRGTFEVTAVRDRTAEQTHTFEVIQIS